MRPLGTVDFATGEPAAAVAERSDVTAVPAMGVIAEAMVAFIVAQAFLEKFGGDSLDETKRNYDAYLAHVAARIGTRSEKSAPHPGWTAGSRKVHAGPPGRRTARALVRRFRR
jgi:hypothetical protein